MRGRGLVEPNPMVGCVIVKDVRIIGEGWHQCYGEAHAECNALASCLESPQGATAYVSLEPCCHTDKKTPPCVPALIAAGLSRVVVGCADPNPKVSGRGIVQLRDAGVQVDVGPLEAECRQLIAPFIAHVVHHRPYVTLKWAQSADGKIAGPRGQHIQISNDRSMQVVHDLRSRCDAILVGINTILNDDPLLTARNGAGERQPVRVVLDRNLRIPVDSRIVQTARDIPTLVGTTSVALDTHAAKGRDLEGAGVMVIGCGDLNSVLEHLAGRFAVTHLLVESGRILASSLIESNLVDRVWIFRSPKVIGAPTAPSAAEVSYPHTGSRELSGDILTEYLNPASSVFFANVASADLLMAG